MSETLQQIRSLIRRGEVRVSNHGYDELAADDILFADALAGIVAAEVVEDSPNYPKGPCVLVLEHDEESRPIHVLWGIPKGKSAPAVLVTAYRPDPDQWSDNFLTRRKP
jgi:hypothetical protein